MNKSLSAVSRCVKGLLAAVCFGSLLGGCASMTRGDVACVRTDSDRARAGNVYLLRGWIGIFSFGINNLGDEINQTGVRAHVFQDTQWSELAVAICEKYANAKNPEPLVLIGHSYGADDVLQIAEQLRAKKIQVDLVVTLDAVKPPAVPSNVKHCYNLYQSNDMWDSIPMFRGIPVKAADGSPTLVENGDVRTNRLDLLEPGVDHFNIEKKAKVHADVIKQVLAVCPPKSTWTATHTAPGMLTVMPVAAPSVALPAVDGRGQNQLSSEHSPASTSGASRASSATSIDRAVE